MGSVLLLLFTVYLSVKLIDFVHRSSSINKTFLACIHNLIKSYKTFNKIINIVMTSTVTYTRLISHK